MKNVERIELGNYEMETWYFSPLPAEFNGVKVRNAGSDSQSSEWHSRFILPTVTPDSRARCPPNSAASRHVSLLTLLTLLPGIPQDGTATEAAPVHFVTIAPEVQQGQNFQQATNDKPMSPSCSAEAVLCGV